MKIRIKHPIYGVPITYLGQQCTDQLKIIGITASYDLNIELIRTDSKKRHRPFINNMQLYSRIIIKRK